MHSQPDPSRRVGGKVVWSVHSERSMEKSGSICTLRKIHGEKWFGLYSQKDPWRKVVWSVLSERSMEKSGPICTLSKIYGGSGSVCTLSNIYGEKWFGMNSQQDLWRKVVWSELFTRSVKKMAEKKGGDVLSTRSVESETKKA